MMDQNLPGLNMNKMTDSAQDRKPLVSIILSVWNPHPEWLAEAIDSAFHESRCQIEVILVDDGSDDPPSKWLSPRDADRVRLFREPHSGVGRAQNIALEHCSGEFVRFLGGDDLILPESTSALLNIIKGKPNLVAYGSTILCNPLLQPYGIIRSRLRGRIHLQTAMGRFSSTIPALLIPRHAAVGIGVDERLVVQSDWDFVLRLSDVLEFQGTMKPVYIYRRHENSLSSGNAARRRAIHSTVLIIKGYLERHPEIRGTRMETRIRAYAQFLIAKLWNPQYPMSSQRFWKASTIDPFRGAAIAGTRIFALGMRAVKNIIFRPRESLQRGEISDSEE
jgi:glycosyltransferase involved in cell wall biosynthesis